MTSNPPSVLVIGAGELGTAVLQALANHPKRSNGKLAVLLRASTINTPDAAKQAANDRLRALGASLEPADVAADAAEDLARVLARFDAVVSCAGFGLPPGTQRKLTRAALLAGSARRRPLRYLPWQFGVDYDAVGAGSAQDLFDEQLTVRALLRSQTPRNVDWLVVSVGVFAEFLLSQPAFGVVDARRRVLRALGPSWDARLTVTATADVGRVVAELVWDPRDELAGAGERGVVYVAGDTLSYARLAELVRRRFGGEWTTELWDEEYLGERLRERPGDGGLKYAGVWAAGVGVAWDVEDTLNARRGMQMLDFESFLAGVPDLE
ncbi:NAD(P)-binding protein [Hypoxylon sp. FL1284]|nr:NAD(P)-binding protein [Hypoxylon sp. FL1284]